MIPTSSSIVASDEGLVNVKPLENQVTRIMTSTEGCCLLLKVKKSRQKNSTSMSIDSQLKSGLGY